MIFTFFPNLLFHSSLTFTQEEFSSLGTDINQQIIPVKYKQVTDNCGCSPLLIEDLVLKLDLK